MFDIYCVYLTVYSGNKLPMFYIGSSSIKKIEKGYHGTVTSKKYKLIWQAELKINSHMFKTIILSKHKSDKEAKQKELKLQVLLKVKNSPMYINESYASPSGFYGRSITGKDHPNYGKKQSEKEIIEKSNRMKKMYEENPQIAKNHSVLMKKMYEENPETSKAHSKRLKLFYKDENNKNILLEKIKNFYDNEEKVKIRSNNLKKSLKKHYENSEERNRMSQIKSVVKYTAISPDGIFYNFKNLSNFCKMHNLNNGHMYQVVKGNENHHKGWKCKLFEGNENEGI